MRTRHIIAFVLAFVLVPLAAHSQSCIPLPSGAVGWWPADGSAVDLVGGNNGTPTGSVSYVPGEVGEGFDLSAASSGILLGNATNLQLQNFTVEAWVQRASTSVASLDPGGTAGGAVFGFGLGGYGFALDAAGHIYLTQIGSGQVNSAGQVTDLNFHHVAVTKNGSAIFFYIDGASAGQTSYNPTFTFGAQAAIGCKSDGFQNSFYGVIDELAVYNRALASNEIYSLYAAGTNGKCEGISIATQPTSEIVRVGGTAIFSVTADGRPPFSYDWFFGSTPIVGATNQTLVITNAQETNAGSYSVLVANNSGRVESSNATLTIGSPPCAPEPAGLVSWWPAEGSAVDLVGGNNGTPTGSVSYVPGEVGEGFDLSAASSGILLGNATNLQLQNFTVEAWVQRASTSIASLDPGGTDGGHVFGFGLGGFAFALDAAGHIYLSQIGSGQVNSTGQVTDLNFHHVAVTKNGSAIFFYIDGASAGQTSYNPTFTFGAQAAIGCKSDGFQNSFYGVIDELAVYNRALSSNEIAGIYAIGAGGKCPNARIVGQPASQYALPGSTATLSATASGIPPLGYQWFFGQEPVPGATNAALVITNVQATNGGYYFMTVTNIYGGDQSSNALLIIGAPPCSTAPSNLLSWWPAESNVLDVLALNNGTLVGNVTYAPGEIGEGFQINAASSGVNVGSATNLHLQNFTIEAWIKRNSASSPAFGSSAGVIFGFGTLGYALAIGSSGNLLLTEIGANEVDATGSVTDTNFHHVAVTKSGSAVDFYVDGNLTDQTTYGATFSFSTPAGIGFRADNLGNVFNGVIDELAVYGRALASNEIAGIYAIGIGGKCPLPAKVVQQPASRYSFIGGSATFDPKVSGAPPFNYQWFFDQTPLAGATNATLTIANDQQTNAGTYYLAVTNGYGGDQSSNALLSIGSPPCSQAPSNLVSWWSAESNAFDNLGGNNGTLTNSVSYVPAQVGYGFQLGAVSSGILLGNATNLQLQTFTIEAWVQRASTSIASLDPGGADGGHILGFGSGGFAFAIDPTGRLYLTKLGTSSIYSTAQIADLNFHHVAVTKSGSVVTFYIDGVPTDQLTYSQVFTFAAQAAIGCKSDTLQNSFYGIIDELAVYNRALSPTEVAGIYSAGQGGKCAISAMPFILSQPVSASVVQRTNATFQVSAGGTPILSYFWFYNGTNIPGATNKSLTLTNVQVSQSGGVYSVLVSNSLGAILSSNATLTVTSGPAWVQVVSQTAIPAQTVSVPINLLANGNENSVQFSLSFSTALLSYVSASAGPGAAGANFALTTTQIPSGRLGFTISLPSNATFPAGTQQVASVIFTVSAASPATAALTFGTAPTAEHLYDNQFDTLPVTYFNGQIAIVTNYEGDVSPRPGGDGSLGLADWAQVGRFVAGLDSPTNNGEFQRADCAPLATGGDGALTAIDWVEAGRYALGDDSVMPATGPTSLTPGWAPAPPSANRQISIGSATLLPGQGTNLNLAVALAAQGTESAAGFSVTFPNALVFLGATAGGGTSMFVNSNQMAAGVVGVLVGKFPGTPFSAGNQTLVTLNFGVANPGAYAVAFTNQPVAGEVSDTGASALPVSFVNGTATLLGPPTLAIYPAGTNVQLAWPSWASNYSLQSAVSIPASNLWTNVNAPVTLSSNQNSAVVGATNVEELFRLKQ